MEGHARVLRVLLHYSSNTENTGGLIMKKLIALAMILVMCFTLLAGCGSDEGTTEGEVQYPIEIKIAHTDSSSRSTHVWAEWLGEYLEEKAPGHFTVEVYSDGQLGDTTDAIAGLGLGTVTMTFDLSSTFAQVAGMEAGCVDLPYLYPTYDSWVEGMIDNGGLELYNEYLAGSDMYCIDLYYNGMRQVISRDKIYHNTEDFAGQKIRIAQNDLDIETWDAMGANPTPMAWGEVVTSLSQGQINALDHSLGVFNDFNLHEIAPYITLTNHASSPFPIVCSLSWIESLPEDDRAILEEGVHQMAASQRDEEKANEDGYIERFKSEGAEVYKLTEDETAALIEACQPVYDWMREQVGDEVVDKWLATVPE